MVMILISVVLLAAAGGGGWYVYTEFLSPPAEGEMPAEETEAAEEVEAPPEDPYLVRMQPMTLPVMRDTEIRQYITLMLQIEAIDQESETLMIKRMPAVRDAIITALYGALDLGDVLQGDLITVKPVKRKIRDAIARVVGPGRVREVLITDVNQRKL